MKYVLDASAAIAFLRGEFGALRVRGLLLDMTNDIHIHAVNVLEIQYKFTSFGGDLTASEAVRDLEALGVKTFDLLPDSLRSRASFFKTRYPFLSLADSVCIAFGEHLKATIITSDRPFANVKDGITLELIR